MKFTEGAFRQWGIDLAERDGAIHHDKEKIRLYKPKMDGLFTSKRYL